MRHAGLAMAALALLPAGLRAEQLDLGLRSEAAWTDNVFGIEEDAPEGKQDDASGRLSPRAELSDGDGDLKWGMRYSPSYEYYLDQSDLRGFDHDVDGRLEWQLAPTTTLRVTDRFLRYHSISRFNEEAAPGETINVIGTRQRFKRNVANVSLDRFLNPQDLVSVSFNHSFHDFSEETRPNRSSFGSTLSYRHQLSEQTSLGSRLGWTRQNFEALRRDDQETDYFSLAGTLDHDFSRTFRMSLSAGPALIRSDAQEIGLVDVDPAEPGTQINVQRYPLRQQGNVYYFLDADTCPQDSLGNRVLGVDCDSVEPPITQGQFNTFKLFNQRRVPLVGSIPGVDESNTTYFAALTLEKEWERWEARLSYSRSLSDSTAVAAVADVVYGSVRWQASRRWTVELSGSFERQQQATENVGLVQVLVNAPDPGGIGPDCPPERPNCLATTQEIRAQEIDSDASVDYMNFFLRFSYALTRRSSVYAMFSWQEQQENGDFLLVGKSERFGVALGVNYFFDPIRL